VIVELAHFALIIALAFAVLLTVVPALGVWRANAVLMHSARTLATAKLVFVAISFLGLCWAFTQDDFSLSVVAANSNTALPVRYKISAVWGNHEGSLLLWILVMAVWTWAVAAFSRSVPRAMQARGLAVMGAVANGFLSFSLFTPIPFERFVPIAPVDGRELNPLLQDFGLIIHPPMLYIGYVGFAVAFAFAIAALSSGRLDAGWARWSRPWTNAAWAFLTLGIALGSWWAYYELGWGGWWFWDPVENASFMPWLCGTALIHSLAVTEKRGVFKSWTVLLAVATFSLSLLGAFLVRSGVLTSVHSFAADPGRGLFMLVFLLIVVGGSLTLYALKAPTVTSRVSFSYLSREFFLLLNNVILVVLTLTVALGTLFPLAMDAMGGGMYSVGPPYFNAVFVPGMAVLLALLGVGAQSRWKRNSKEQLFKPLWIAAAAAVVFGAVAPLVIETEYNMAAALAGVVAFWIIFTACQQLWQQRGRKIRMAQWTMFLGHIGIAVTALGVCLTSQYSVERDLRMEEGQMADLGGVQIRFAQQGQAPGPNYVSEFVDFELMQDGVVFNTLRAEKRRYRVQQNMMTEAAIDAGFWRDIYVALGERIDDKAWGVRLHYKPFVRWMWLGALIMAAAGLLSIGDKRYRLRANTGGEA
jgi:cytochrome c-type biogenesis protein CcmF